MVNKTIDTLVQDIYDYLEHPAKEGYLNDEDVTELAKEIAAVLKKRSMERKRDSFNLRVSNYGKPARQLWFEAHTDPRTYAPKAATLVKFLYGDIIEAMLLFLAKQAGHTVTHEQGSVSVAGVEGHLDAVIDGDTVIDVKSASKFAFAKKFKRGAVLDKADDSFGYVPQIKAYQQALDLPNSAFLAACKETGELSLLPVEGEYPDSIKAEQLMKQAQHIISLDTPPVEKCYPDEKEGESGNRTLNTNCTYCNHKFKCWGEQLRVFEYANGPKYFTKVVKRPQSHIPEVTQVMREYHEDLENGD